MTDFQAGVIQSGKDLDAYVGRLDNLIFSNLEIDAVNQVSLQAERAYMKLFQEVINLQIKGFSVN